MPYEQAAYTQASPTAIKQLLSGGTYTTRKVTILSGQNLGQGAVIGKITTGGKYILSLSGASDGSQTPDLVTLYAVDASGGDKEAIVLESCTHGLNKEALILGTGHTIASIREGLRAKGILIAD